MNPKSWISPKATKGMPSEIHGRGLFANASIEAGDVVAVKAGYLLTGGELVRHISEIRNSQMQVGDNLFLAPSRADEVDDSMIFMNHSCDPNIYVRGDITVVSRQQVTAGTELTLDYGAIFTSMEPFECNCRSSECRLKITGEDWMLPELQRRYGTQFPSFILAKITQSRH